MKYLFVLLLIGFSFCHARFIYTDFEAKQFLREYGAKYSDFISDAKIIISDGLQVKGTGGICIDLPIYACISPENIILLNGASGYKTNSGSVVMEADYLSISAVVIGKYLVVGQSFKDIANYVISRE